MHCRAGAPSGVGGAPVSLQSAYGSLPFSVLSASLMPSAHTVSVPGQPIPPRSGYLGIIFGHLSLHLPYCFLSPPPTRANSGCVWRARVSLGHLSSLFLSLSLCGLLGLSASVSLSPCLFWSIFVPAFFSIFPCKHLTSLLVPTSFPKFPQPSCPPRPPPAPTPHSSFSKAFSLSPLFHLPWRPLSPSHLPGSITDSHPPFLSLVLSPAISSPYPPSPTSIHRSETPSPTSIPGPISCSSAIFLPIPHTLSFLASPTQTLSLHPTQPSPPALPPLPSPPTPNTPQALRKESRAAGGQVVSQEGGGICWRDSQTDKDTRTLRQGHSQACGIPPPHRPPPRICKRLPSASHSVPSQGSPAPPNPNVCSPR